MNFSENVIIAVISTLIGTSAGTILGWILGKIKIGKLCVKVTDFTEHYIYFNSKNGTSSENTKGELIGIRCSFNIMIHNSSDMNMALRCLQINFLDERNGFDMF